MIMQDKNIEKISIAAKEIQDEEMEQVSGGSSERPEKELPLIETK